MDITVTINAPALAEAINNLASAISSKAKPAIIGVLAEADKKKGSATQQQVITPPVAPVPQPVQQQTIPAEQKVSAIAPTTATKSVTLEALCEAGARLVENGNMNQVIALLGKYGVQAINRLDPSNYDAFAADLRSIGASI